MDRNGTFRFPTTILVDYGRLSGAIGTEIPKAVRTRFAADLEWTGRESTNAYSEDAVTVVSASHPDGPGAGPARTPDGEATVWVWGAVWGFDGPDGYETPERRATPYCASLYADHGMEFVSGLNGNFVGIVHDRAEETVSLFTDRLATRPIHYYRTDDGVVFSTNVQSLPLHPAVEARFDVEYLAEYFALKRTFGVKTPLEGVELLQPGSVTTVDLDGGHAESERYWTPVHEPVDEPRSYFTRRLADLLRQAAAERTEDGDEYGLLLSGGSDSRLTLAALRAADRSVRAYHLADWENHEMRVARRVASAADVPFTLLRRGQDYQARALASTPRFSNFVGYFNQIHAAGFEDVLREDVDFLYTGHYGDMLFKGNHVPTRRVDLGGLGSFELPIETSGRSLEEYVEQRVSEAPSYVEDALTRSMREIYAANVERDGSRIVDHGVAYESLREAMLCSRCPLTNGTSQFFYYGTLQMLPSGTLFLDNRLIDLFLSIPTSLLVRGNLIGGALERLDPELAGIPHGNTNVPLSYPFPAQKLGGIATAFKRRHLSRPFERDHWTAGPWPNHAELIRSHGFVRETIDAHEEYIRSMPFLSWPGVNECDDEHVNGANNMAALYTLVTFLEMPLTHRLAPNASPSQ